jgi:homoserine dehydrogenase
LRALFLGFGNVGRAVAEILAHRERYPGLTGADITVVGIVTGSHGAKIDPDGIDLAQALSEFHSSGGFPPALRAGGDIGYDAVVEMTPLDRRRRGEPAITHVREALARGRHAVSANKGPLAWAFRDLSRLARDRGLRFLYETAVMDGVPVFNLVRHGLRGATVHRVEGILNSTTNAILSALERGESFEEALARAQRDGVAEADPGDDLEGWDAAVKVSALANVLMDGDLPPESVAREGIVGVDAARVRETMARGARLKLVGEAWRDADAVQGRVVLREVPMTDPFALVEDTSNILRLVTDLAGRIVITEERPDIRVTAYGVISDLLTLIADAPQRPM